MKKVFFALLALLFAALPARAGEPRVMEFDVAVVGAGCGGAAAAIQAARLGMEVAVVEESDWVGGQMTGGGVSTMDDVRRTRTGIYGEFLRRASAYYDARETPVNTCYWGSDTFAFEPWVAQMTLLDMMREAGGVSLFMKTRVLEAKMKGGAVRAALLDKEGEKIELRAKVFIDATEAGDFIPLTGARYRAGHGDSSGEIDGVIQDITYVAVIKRYPAGVPEELKFRHRPPHYEEYAPKFREIIAADGGSWPGDAPFNINVFKAYRGMPDISNPASPLIDCGRPETWPLITRSAVNWANDYPHHRGGLDGMPARYLEDKEYRREADREAMAKTLCFLFYMQNELGMADWSVDDRQGYGGWFGNDWREWDEMPDDFEPILRHFPPFPYIRESRRIAGVETMTVKDVIRDMKLGRTLETKSNAIALGEYPTDIHGLRDKELLDRDLDEDAAIIPPDTEWKGGLFQIPMGVLIPEKVDGLLAAEKNISVSRIVNGSTRLQPVTMLTGQAAGALAAVAVRGEKQPREVRAIEVQSPLLDARDRLSLYRFDDVPQDSVWWKGVELSMLYGYLDPASDVIYGVDNEMHWLEVRDAMRRAFGRMEFPPREALDTVTAGEFGEWLAELFKDERETLAPLLEKCTGDEIMTKGRLAAAVGELMLLRK